MSEGTKNPVATPEIIQRRGLPEKSGRLPGAVASEKSGILETIQGETSRIRSTKQGKTEGAQSDQKEPAPSRVYVVNHCKHGHEKPAKTFDIRVL